VGTLVGVHRVRTVAAGLAAALLLAGCAAGAGASAPSWVPKPSFEGEGPGGSVPAQQQPPDIGPGSGSPSTTNPNGKVDPDVVATRLNSPVGLTLLPDGTALVGERRTGRIVRVQPEPGQLVQTVRTLPGVDGSGDGGLLDLALSPNYSQDGLIFAYLTTARDNRVVDFTLTGPITPVVTDIPKGRIDNSGRLLFGPDGDLYIGTSDAGRPALAARPTSLAGKILRVTDVGTPAKGNPTRGSPVYTSGQHVLVGLCLDDESGTILSIDADGVHGRGRVDVVRAGGYYGWPRPSAVMYQPVAVLPAADTTPGGCTVLNSTVYASSLDGRAILAAALSVVNSAVSFAKFGPVIANKYGRLRTVVAAPDGALWITTSNKDGYGKPVSADERVLRILPSGGAASTFPG
jgi:glucose/arabinose dehydrogenase